MTDSFTWKEKYMEHIIDNFIGGIVIAAVAIAFIALISKIVMLTGIM